VIQKEKKNFPFVGKISIKYSIVQYLYIFVIVSSCFIPQSRVMYLAHISKENH